MREDHRTRSPHRGRGQGGQRDFQGRRDDYSRSRQDYSRSPTRHDLRDGLRERDVDHGRVYDGDGPRHSRYAGGSRGPGRRPRDDHDYSGMYDDDGGGEADYYRRREDERRHRDRRDYRSRDNDRGFRSPPRRRHSRSRSQSPLRDAGRPSDTVILEGLPFTISASELQESILRNSIAAEFPSIDVRVSSSKGHRRAFVQFESVDSAVVFIKEHFPKLLLELPHPTDELPDGKFDAYVHYARSRDDADGRGASNGNWTCPTCDFSNYPTRNKCKICGISQSTTEDNWQQSLTGLTDAANVPSQILVVYPLAGFVTEDMLAGDMKRLELEKPNPAKDSSNGGPKLKSTAPTGDASGYGARPGSLHRVFLMRDVYNNESFKYGFAEFWTLEDAAAAMAKFRASRNFAVAACTVNISTIHMGVFLPEDRELTPDIESMSFNPLFNPSLRVRYRDVRLYPSQRVVTSEPPAEDKTKPTGDDASDAKKSKKRKAEGSLPATATKKPVAMAGQMAKWQRKHDELHGQNSTKEPADPDKASQDTSGSPDTLPKTDHNGPIKISLSGARIGGSQLPPDAANGTPNPEKHEAPQRTAGSEKPEDPERDVSYVDRDRLMCLICMRKYKSVDEVNIHENSRNHKTATEDQELVKAALPRLAARDKRLQKQAGENGGSDAEPQYRDRAKERREAYNQPKKASAQAPSKSDASKAPKKQEPAPPKAPQQSKGAGMLAKMGWTTGAGLGATGEGRTDVIPTNAYQEGVGLGAEGGNLGDAAQLAERKTKNNYADYLSSVQDKARERYNKLG